VQLDVIDLHLELSDVEASSKWRELIRGNRSNSISDIDAMS